MIAFHEKAGRSQVGSCWFLLVSCFPAESPLSPPFHPHSYVSDSSLGASWVFSFQPVLPPVYRPCLPSRGWKLGQAFNAVTGTRRWALSFPSHSRRRLPAWVGCYFARVRRSLRSPTTDAARPLAFPEAVRPARPKHSTSSTGLPGPSRLLASDLQIFQTHISPRANLLHFRSPLSLALRARR